MTTTTSFAVPEFRFALSPGVVLERGENETAQVDARTVLDGAEAPLGNDQSTLPSDGSQRFESLESIDSFLLATGRVQIQRARQTLAEAEAREATAEVARIDREKAVEAQIAEIENSLAEIGPRKQALIARAEAVFSPDESTPVIARIIEAGDQEKAALKDQQAALKRELASIQKDNRVDRENAASQLKSLTERLCALETALPEIAASVQAAENAEAVRKTAVRFAREGDVLRAEELYEEARRLEPASEYLPAVEQALLAAREKAEVRNLLDSIQAVRLTSKAGETLDTLEAKAASMGLLPRVVNAINRQRKDLARERGQRWADTRRYAEAWAESVAQSGAVILFQAGLVKIYETRPTGYALLETHLLLGNGEWKRRREPGRVTLPQLPDKGTRIDVT